MFYGLANQNIWLKHQEQQAGLSKFQSQMNLLVGGALLTALRRWQGLCAAARGSGDERGARGGPI